MALDTQEIRRLFNAGIATVAINSPTSCELAVTDKIASDIADLAGNRPFEFYIWDLAKGLQKVEPTTRSGQITSFKKSPAANYKTQGHPVEALLKHIEAECQSSSPNRTLFLIKDLYPFVGGINPNPVLVRLAIDSWTAAKRSPNRIIILHDNLITPRAFEDLVVDLENPLPSEVETETILSYRIQALQKSARGQSVEFPVELDPKNHKRLVRALLGMTQEAADDIIQYCAVTHGCLDETTIEVVNQLKTRKYATRGIEYAPAPDVEVQGLPFLKEWATTITPLLEPEAQELYNIPFPKGALIVGVGGTGKSLSVKCFAKEWGLPVIVLDTGKLMTKDLGGSESNLRDAIAAAESMAPCILFIDEMDKMFPGSSGNETDGGTSQRMFGYFLKWFQERSASVFVAATANRPWGFKPELLRRFSRVWYVPLPNTEAREQIWRVQLQYYKLSLSQADISRLAIASAGFTGAEIRNITESCASIAYAQHRPTQVTTEELLRQGSIKPPQFTNSQELEALEEWVRSGQAHWAAPDPRTSTHPEVTDRQVSWERNIIFPDSSDFN